MSIMNKCELYGLLVLKTDLFPHLVPADPVQERFQPALGALAVRVEVGDDGSLDVLSTQQPRSDQPHPLRGPDDPHLGVVGHVGLQLPLQVAHRAGVVHQDDLVWKQNT